MLLEGPLKRGFGAVADSLGDGTEADAAFDQFGCDLHSPAAEVLNWRLSGETREPLGQRGARQPALLGQCFERPVLRRAHGNQLQRSADILVPQAGQRHDVAAFTDASLSVVSDAIGDLPTDECEIFFAHIGGAATRVAPEATPWPNREPHFVVNVHTRWRDPGDDARCRDWARKLHRDLEPHAMGSVYVNFMPEGDEDRVAEAYGPNYDRLARIKQRVDPTNLFRGNQNIGPGGTRSA